MKIRRSTGKSDAKIMFALTCNPWYNDRDTGNSPGGLPFSHSVRCPLPCRSGSFGVADVSETSVMLAVA